MTSVTYNCTNVCVQTAWLGGQHEILLFGDGNNIIPMIHVIDLARL